MDGFDWLLIILLVASLLVVWGALFGAPFLPTRAVWIDDALRLAKVSNKDVVVDLGSGSGAVLRRALRRGTKRAVGYEVNPVLALYSRLRLLKYGKRAQIYNNNFLKMDLPTDTTAVYLFGIERIMCPTLDYLRHQKKRLSTKRLRVVCYGFELPDVKPIRKDQAMTLYYL